MQQTIHIAGMTCEACEYKIEHILGQIPGINSLKANAKTNEVVFEVTHKIADKQIIETLLPHLKYKFIANNNETITKEIDIGKTSFFPLLLIFFFISVVAFGAVWPVVTIKPLLHHFMTGFFLVFSFFKLLDITGFASSFSMYDIVAKKFNLYGNVYPFIELTLGLFCLFHFQPQLVYVLDIIVMGVGLIGVLQAVFSKQTIKCACLGTGFNLPMTTVTIIENSLMILIGVLLLVL